MSRGGKEEAEELQEVEEKVIGGEGEPPLDAAQVESLINSFVAVTSADRDDSRRYLEICGWNMEQALNSFFIDQEDDLACDSKIELEGDGDEEEREEGNEVDSDDEDYVPSENEDADNAVAVHVSGSGSRGKEKAGKQSRKVAFTTFSDLKRNAKSDSDTDSDTESDEDQDFHAGGKTRKRSRNSEKVFEKLRKFARPGPSSSKSKSFTGRGRVLSSEGTPSSGVQHTAGISYNIYFWRNGFSVNNGPLRGFDDPQNAEFLESIEKSECPEELKSSDGSSEISVKVIHNQTNYSTLGSRPPHKKPACKAFRGTGRTLGTEPEQLPDPTADVPVPGPTPASNATSGFRVDESLPTTSLQIRLSDGTRLVARFNTSNTISDLRAFIDASRSSGTSAIRSYQLQTVGFPPKLLDDLSKTIEEEGIANSVVIQKA